jgi:hypothetical protein
MPCTDATKTFAEKVRARDWNRVLAPWLFSERGLADLKSIIERHGRDTMDEAVRGFLSRSKTDRNIARGYVRSWKYFTPLCEQTTMEDSKCAE